MSSNSHSTLTKSSVHFYQAELHYLGKFASCRRVARELVERWSRPIFDQYREHDSEALKEQYNEELAKARQRRQLKEAKAAAALNAGPPLHLTFHK